MISNSRLALVNRKSTIATVAILALVTIAFLKGWLPSPLASISRPHPLSEAGHPALMGLHVGADVLTGLCYVAISIMLAVLAYRNRRRMPFSWMILALGVFIVAGGAEHLLDIVVLWTPLYWLESYVKALTAFASLATAVAMAFVLPKLQSILEAREQVRKLQRERALKTESCLAMAQGAARLVNWEWDIKEDRITWVPSSEPLYGTPTAELRDLRSWLMCIHPDDRDRVAENIERTLKCGDLELEFRIITLTGDTRWISSRGKVRCDENRTPLKMIGINLDVTDRRMAEEALRISEKAAATGRLAATIAHEINNPLESVTNLLYLLRSNPTIEGDAKEYLAIAQQELSRIAHITRNTLSFHRESANPVPVKLAEVLESVVALCEPKLRRKGAQIRCDLDRNVEVHGYPAELRQVFVNLVMNASDALDSNGLIEIKSRVVGATAYISVCDTGRGIQKDVQNKIFEPFFTTKGEKGTGVGLWVTKEIIERHGGSIGLKSEIDGPNRGTTFRIVLPVRQNDLAMTRFGHRTFEQRASAGR